MNKYVHYTWKCQLAYSLSFYGIPPPFAMPHSLGGGGFHLEGFFFWVQIVVVCLILRLY